MKFERTTLNGKPAVKVEASRVIWGRSAKSQLFDFGDKREEWIPNSISTFTYADKDKADIEAGFHVGNIKGTLILHEWFFRKLFPD